MKAKEAKKIALKNIQKNPSFKIYMKEIEFCSKDGRFKLMVNNLLPPLDFKVQWALESLGYKFENDGQGNLLICWI